MFRNEVLSHRFDRLSGDVLITIPVSWQSIGYLVFGGIAAALIFLSVASYSRVETVTGIVLPDKGVSAIMPMRSGVVSEIAVSDGQLVAVGEVLANIRAEEDSFAGAPVAARIEDAIRRQDRGVATQIGAAKVAASAQLSQLAAQRSGLTAEIHELEAQLTLQLDLVTLARSDYERASRVADRGFLSRRDLEQRQEVLLARQQTWSQLTQSLASKEASLRELGRSEVQLSAQAQALEASLAADRAVIAQQAAATAGSRSYVLRAPVAGRVTALTARIGQVAMPQTQLMAIVPSASVLRAELAVPSAAIGFVKPGQEVSLAIDAFPYQRFGTVKGRVLTVSTSAIGMPGANGSTVLTYPVTVGLSRESISAFGRLESLTSGMTLTARIVTERQSLMEWLFEPLFAVRRR